MRSCGVEKNSFQEPIKLFNYENEEFDKRYGEGLEAVENSFEILGKIAVIRACLKKGGEPDTEKAAKLVIDDLRSCKLGNITLEKVADL